MMLYTLLQSPIGELLLTSRQDKLTGLYFADQPHAPAIHNDWIRRDNDDLFVAVDRQLYDFASGERQYFDIPYELNGTPFQKRIWQEISTIPYGQTVTYSDLAVRIGSLNAVRPIGSATGANPLSWIIPCHRVVGKNGALTGYAGGLARKDALLDFEATTAAGLDAILTVDKMAANANKKSKQKGSFAPAHLLRWEQEPTATTSQHAA